MTKVVIYGEYPPIPGPAAEATLLAVKARLAAGDEVEVVSPRPSAAHHHADLGTVAGAACLARLAPGADLELELDPAVLGDGGGGGRWAGRRGAPAQALLALAVRSARRATVHVGPLGPPAGRGLVRLVLGSADRVTAASAADADALERAGIRRDRLSVRGAAGADTDPGGSPGAAGADTDPGGSPGAAGAASSGVGAANGAAGPAGAPPGLPARPPWPLGDDPSRAELEATVRLRAAEDRQRAAGNSAASTWPLHLLTPFTPPPASSGKPLFALAKKVVQRLTAWVVLPMAEHMNHLQQATIESIDRHAALPDHSGDRQITIT